MVTVIERGDVLAPGPAGPASVLVVGGRVVQVGAVDRAAVDRVFPDAGVIDAAGCYVCPGLIDPHAHLIGAGGEQGFASRQPELTWQQLALAGVTSVVGCLGTDAVTRTLPGLIGKARELAARGLSVYCYTGSFQVPPPTLTGSVHRDIVLIPEVIGVGEVAVADVRSSQPTVAELARIVADAYVAGTLAGKAGVTHFHVGPSDRRLADLHALLDGFDIVPRCLYPTHVTRTRALMDDAIALARRGAFVDTDTVEPGTAKWLKYYLEHGGPPERLTFSSDAQTPGGSPHRLFAELVAAVREHEVPLARALPHFTANAAAALGLARKGRLEAGADADLLVVDRRTLEVRDVMAGGRLLVRNGSPVDS
ncbi:MAG TPA: amidohydrolase family protein [Tepidisphaeraceae bacterium]|nr:amidohydrolase family protein [Tepidisphaeraceae bacterium]